jgi:hypothetical protein
LELNRKLVLVATGVGVAAIAATSWLFFIRVPPDTVIDSFPVPGTDIAGTVEVLNGTERDGLARSVTRKLRLAGIDVVYFGTARPVTDTTKIVVRRGDTTLAGIVGGILGQGRIETDIDSSLLLDVSVLLGNDYLEHPDSLPQ